MKSFFIIEPFEVKKISFGMKLRKSWLKNDGIIEMMKGNCAKSMR